MKGDELSDDQILYAVNKADAELFERGLDVKARSWEVPRLIMEQLGYTQYVTAGFGKPAILDRIEAAFNAIYRKEDLAAGGHIGVFMYRDTFARILVPRIYGEIALNPFEFVELTPVQLRIIQTEPREMSVYIDQFCDVLDIEYGSSELQPVFAKMEPVTRFVQLSRLHLHAAAAILTGGYDYRGAVQSALLATELGLKAAVAAQRVDEAEIRNNYGHNLLALVDKTASRWPRFSADRVRRALDLMPGYVSNRYSSEQPKRRRVGQIVMATQYVLAEVIRQMSDRNLRSALSPPSERSFP